MADDNPFHKGEEQLKALSGVREAMASRGRAFIRDHMPDQHRSFFAQLPFVIAGGLDGAGQPWATVWAGEPGFMQSPDPRTLDIQARSLPGDPLAAHWHEGSPVGLLGIEPHTRRRNRMNGTLRRADHGAFEVEVRQSFGNCPKYIRPRRAEWAQTLGDATVSALGPWLQGRARELVSLADTFFIASASSGAGRADQVRSDGVDVSHRGGESGFIHLQDVADGTELTVPDYVGNFMFNTLGNVLVRPGVGLLFLDVVGGDVLWLAGHGRVDLDPQAAALFNGAQRLLRVRITQGCLARGVSPLLWDGPSEQTRST
jgi:predicted pyridoxine 5'-phosphate oxidase superfamily flavin-nucleotide-binding protein